MARPKKENADYHTHDKDMRNDPKIRALRKKFKHEGYAVYNMMLEVLTGSDNWEYPWNEFNIELLNGDFDSENVEDIIKYCVSPLGLFTIENNSIYSKQHRKRFIPLLSKRKRDNKAVSDSENPHSKVKYSIVKESKGEGTSNTAPTQNNFFNNENGKSEKGILAGKFEPPEFEEVGKFFFDQLKNYWDGSKCNLVAQKFFNHYKSLGWKTAADADVEDWKALANKWILKDLEDDRKAKKVNVPRHTPQQAAVADEARTVAFIESIFKEFKAGTTIEPEIPADIYDFLLGKELLILTADEKANILTRSENNGNLAKKKSVAEYFTKLVNDGCECVFQLQK